MTPAIELATLLSQKIDTLLAKYEGLREINPETIAEVNDILLKEFQTIITGDFQMSVRQSTSDSTKLEVAIELYTESADNHDDLSS